MIVDTCDRIFALAPSNEARTPQKDAGMRIGHVCLDRHFNGIGEHIVSLVEGLAAQGASQHIIVRNQPLAKRLSLYENVTVGPTTGASVVACRLMPPVDLIHSHDDRSAQVGLLLQLTRSIPFVLTRRSRNNPTDNPITQAYYRRAGSVICTTDAASRALLGMDASLQIDVIPDIRRSGAGDGETPGNRIAAEHLRVYHRVADQSGIPALLL